jgi:hypothetical protein
MIHFTVVSKDFEFRKGRWAKFPVIEIRVGGFIDFRQWYTYRENGKESDLWFLENELQELKKEIPDAEIVRIPKWKTIFRP